VKFLIFKLTLQNPTFSATIEEFAIDIFPKYGSTLILHLVTCFSLRKLKELPVSIKASSWMLFTDALMIDFWRQCLAPDIAASVFEEAATFEKFLPGLDLQTRW
jgi:hypothetical protein